MRPGSILPPVGDRLVLENRPAYRVDSCRCSRSISETGIRPDRKVSVYNRFFEFSPAPIIRKNLKSALFEYYRYDQSQRQYLSLQLMTEFRHFELASGILTNEQYLWLQDEIGYFDPATHLNVEFTPDQLNALVEAAQRIKGSPDLVAWLPESRGMRLDLKVTHDSRLARATALLAVLQKLDTAAHGGDKPH
jgi:hypothetical protein